MDGSKQLMRITSKVVNRKAKARAKAKAKAKARASLGLMLIAPTFGLIRTTGPTGLTRRVSIKRRKATTPATRQVLMMFMILGLIT